VDWEFDDTFDRVWKRWLTTEAPDLDFESEILCYMFETLLKSPESEADVRNETHLSYFDACTARVPDTAITVAYGIDSRHMRVRLLWVGTGTPA
jgi:hypothetical protein